MATEISDPDRWREKADGFRERAKDERDAARRRALLALADAADEFAANLEEHGVLELRSSGD